MNLVNQPLVSVCIPAYNQVDDFKAALSSVLDQSYKCVEIIVTDDSTNSAIFNFLTSTALIEKVRYSINTLSLGSPRNWNAAISLAKGKYVKIMHQDDRFANSNALAKFVEFLEKNPQVDMVFSGLVHVNTNSGASINYMPKRGQLASLKVDPRILYAGNFIGPPSAIMYRNSNSFFFDTRFLWLVDIDFYISNWAGAKISFIPEYLIEVSVDGVNQITRECESNSKVQIYEYFTLYEKIAAKNSAYKKNIDRHLRIIAANFGISDINEIQKYGFSGGVPYEVCANFKYTRINKFLGKIIARL